MPRDLLEKILWSLSVDRFSKTKFKESPEKFLSRFPLSDADRAMILEFDVKGLQAAGVNPMLTMGFWVQLSPEPGMKLYNQRLGSDSSYSASLKGERS